jgi:hypothetical protein
MRSRKPISYIHGAGHGILNYIVEYHSASECTNAPNNWPSDVRQGHEVRGSEGCGGIVYPWMRQHGL